MGRNDVVVSIGALFNFFYVWSSTKNDSAKWVPEQKLPTEYQSGNANYAFGGDWLGQSSEVQVCCISALHLCGRNFVSQYVPCGILWLHVLEKAGRKPKIPPSDDDIFVVVVYSAVCSCLYSSFLQCWSNTCGAGTVLYFVSTELRSPWQWLVSYSATERWILVL